MLHVRDILRNTGRQSCRCCIVRRNTNTVIIVVGIQVENYRRCSGDYLSIYIHLNILNTTEQFEKWKNIVA